LLEDNRQDFQVHRGRVEPAETGVAARPRER
jgi:hypothetical protein